MKLDLEIMRQAVENFNKTYISEYLATSYEPETVNPPSSPIPLLDANNEPKYDERFFDLMCANLLLRECDPKKYPLTANTAELISRLGYEGLRHCGIMLNDCSRREFCNNIALNRMPNPMQVWDYLLWVERYDHNAAPMWFYYTLLLWVLLEDKHNKQYSYRSRMLITLSAEYALTPVRPDSERRGDVLRVQKKLKRLITAGCKHDFELSGKDQLVPYLLSVLREFSIVTIASMVERTCAFEIFQPLGMVTRAGKERFHQKVVDQFYKTHRQP